MKLIDAEALKEEILKAPVWTGLDVITRINAMPSIDIVRCKECNAYMTDGYVVGYGFCAYHQSVVKADDYCSYGERKE